jgi:hypothetical protein
MKRSLIVVLAATFASVAFAANDQYRNEAGEQDQHAPIASAEQYRNSAGEQDLSTPIASNDEYRNEAGQRDEHSPQVG